MNGSVASYLINSPGTSIFKTYWDGAKWHVLLKHVKGSEYAFSVHTQLQPTGNFNLMKSLNYNAAGAEKIFREFYIEEHLHEEREADRQAKTLADAQSETEGENLVLDLSLVRGEGYEEKKCLTGSQPCLICGRPVHITDTTQYVHLLTTGKLVNAEEHPKSQGFYPVGRECAKRLPKWFVFNSQFHRTDY